MIESLYKEEQRDGVTEISKTFTPTASATELGWDAYVAQHNAWMLTLTHEDVQDLMANGSNCSHDMFRNFTEGSWWVEIGDNKDQGGMIICELCKNLRQKFIAECLAETPNDEYAKAIHWTRVPKS
jgi:hypothetical protein